jgi:drug/metabolite transporter (DMT)-like permease
VLLGEPILPSMIIGGVVALAGVSLTNWSRAAPTPQDGGR